MSFKNLFSDKKRAVLTAGAAVLAVALIISAVFVLTDMFKSKKNGKNTQISVSAASAADDAEDPENTELSEQGANVNADDLYHENGKANGIDVSKWQGKIDWKKVKSSGIDFAVIRIGFRGENGTLYKDAYADYNLQQAEKYGILTGVYFFSTAKTQSEAAEEAEWTAGAVAGYSISYPIVYDCEGFLNSDSRMFGLNNSIRTDNAVAFMKRVKELGYEAMFYAAHSELTSSKYWDTERIEKNGMVWVARYPSVPYPATKKPDYNGKYDMWQYTNMGKVSGVDGNVDMIVSYFTREKAAAKNPSSKANKVEAPQQNDNIYTAANDSVTAKIETNLRVAASTKSEIAATIKNGEFVERNGIGSNGWSRLVYNGQTVYAITSYLTNEANAASEPTAPSSVTEYGMTFTFVNRSVTAKESTNLRSAPNTDSSQVVYTLKSGEFVTQTGTSASGWARLEYNGQTVYAIESYLSQEVVAVKPDTTVTEYGMEFDLVNDTVTAKEETYLRTSPSTSESQVVYTLKNGETIKRTGISKRGWSRLELNGQVVYAVTSLLQ